MIDTCAVVSSSVSIFCHIVIVAIVNVHDSYIDICVSDFSLFSVFAMAATEYSIG